MTVITAGTEREMAHGMRPMDPARDLGRIAKLITDAFADEIDERGRAALREMRWMARLSPLVWWWAQADPSFSDTFNGFVWEEPSPAGRGSALVGNASLNRAPGSLTRRIICNVVVLDAYRGRGIGRQLIEAAMTEAWDLGAQEIVLQVHQENDPALRLYTALGFQEAGGETDLQLQSIRRVAPPETHDYLIRDWRSLDGQATYELAQRAISEAQQWLRPVRADRYRRDWWQTAGTRLTDLIAGRRVRRLVALEEDQLVALMTVTAALRGGYHKASLLVHPDHTGHVEAMLIGRALNLLADSPSRPLKMTVDKAQTFAIDVLLGYGFEERRTLLTLRKGSGQS